jgi:hypothetical protein
MLLANYFSRPDLSCDRNRTQLRASQRSVPILRRRAAEGQAPISDADERQANPATMLAQGDAIC